MRRGVSQERRANGGGGGKRGDKVNGECEGAEYGEEVRRGGASRRGRGDKIK